MSAIVERLRAALDAQTEAWGKVHASDWYRADEQVHALPCAGKELGAAVTEVAAEIDRLTRERFTLDEVIEICGGTDPFGLSARRRAHEMFKRKAEQP